MKSIPFSVKIRRFVILALSVTFLVTSLMILIFTFKGNRESIITLAQNQLDLISLNIENKIDTIKQTTLGLMFNSSIQNALCNPEILKSYEEYNIIAYVLSDHRNFSNSGNVILFDVNGNMLTSSNGYSTYRNICDASYFSMLEESNGEEVWIGPHIDAYDYNTNEKVISLAQKVRYLDPSFANSGRVIGYILVNIEVSEFHSLLADSHWFPNGRLSLAMAGNIEVAQWGNDEGKFIFLSIDLENEGWTLEGTIPISNILSLPSWLAYVFVVEMILILIFSYVVSRVSHSMTESLEKLECVVKKQDLDSIPTDLNETGILEIDSMQASYNSMITRLCELSHILANQQIKEKEIEYASVQAELSALRHQINPHFLYNTLDSINWMAEDAGCSEISDMIIHLASFLRFHTKARETVTLRQELENADNYVYIQKIRYGSRFSYYKDCDECLMDIQTIPLIIQPIVENSLVHSNEFSDIEVRVTVYKEGDTVFIEIKDNGAGIKKEKLCELRREIETGESIGLSNVSKRLRLYYRDKASLTIASEEGKGTVIVIAFPEKTEKN